MLSVLAFTAAALFMGARAARAAIDYEDVEIERQAAADLPSEAAPSAAEPPASTPPTEMQALINAQLRGKGIWGYQFIWVKADGTRVVLSEHNPDRPMIPASTMKLFTGYFGFKRQARPLAQLSEILHKSLNAQANALLAACGGSKALRKFLEGLGFSIGKSLTIYDGSGFDARNRASAHLQVSLLEHILRTTEYSGFKVLLAQPGQVGTLEDRLTDMAGALYAKTGTLPASGDVALSGYLEESNGTVIFSMMGNGLNRKSIAWARAVIDSAVRLHGGYVARYGPTNRSAPRVASLASFTGF